MNGTFSHREARPMRRLSVATWIGNAAAVLLGRWGDVSRQAEAAGCSRQIAYQHARRVQQAVAHQDGDGPTRQGLRDEIQALRREDRQLWDWLEHTVELPKAKRRHFATVAAAMGLSSRQIASLSRSKNGATVAYIASSYSTSLSV